MEIELLSILAQQQKQERQKNEISKKLCFLILRGPPRPRFSRKTEKSAEKLSSVVLRGPEI